MTSASSIRSCAPGSSPKPFQYSSSRGMGRIFRKSSHRDHRTKPHSPPHPPPSLHTLSTTPENRTISALARQRIKSAETPFRQQFPLLARQRDAGISDRKSSWNWPCAAGLLTMPPTAHTHTRALMQVLECVYVDTQQVASRGPIVAPCLS